MASRSVLALGAGRLRASLQVSRQIIRRTLCNAENLVPRVRLVAAPKSTSTVNSHSTVRLHWRPAETSPRFMSVQANTEGTEMATASIRSVPVQDAKELLSTGHRYLDVRTTEEFAGGHIEGAVNIPFMNNVGGGMTKNLQFVEDVSKVFQKGDEVVVGCLSGRRSAAAATELQAAEFSNITDMAGGYKSWIDSGLPTVAKA